MGDYSDMPWDERWRWRIETSKQMANVWAMFAVASYAAAFFEGQWVLGLLFGFIGIKMVTVMTKSKVEAEKGLEEWKSLHQK